MNILTGNLTKILMWMNFPGDVIGCGDADPEVCVYDCMFRRWSTESARMPGDVNRDDTEVVLVDVPIGVQEF